MPPPIRVTTLTPQLTTDSAGNWIAVWYSFDTLEGTIGEDSDILFARSIDNGQTWTEPAPLTDNAHTDSGLIFDPQIATDSAGNWIVVWASRDSLDGAIGEDHDIVFSRSTDLARLGPTRHR